MPAYMIALVVILPLVIGIVCGFLSGFILRRDNGDGITLALLIVIILFTSVAGFFFNNRVMPTPILNFMLMGMAFSATFSNMMSENRLEQIMRVFNKI